jgi:hypothetical protein
MKKIMILLVMVSLVSIQAHAAGALSGDYMLASNCSFKNGFFGQTAIQKGKITVSEEIPVGNSNGVGTHQAIIFQDSDDFNVVLELGIGNVQAEENFSGPSPFSQGTYTNRGSVFVEQFSSTSGATFDSSTVELEKTTSGLNIIADGHVCPLVSAN